MDTRNKRAGAVHVGLPWRGMYPAPDGTIGQGDRQQVAALYPGVLAGEPPEVVTAVAVTFTVPAEDRTFAVGAEDRTFAVGAEDRTFTVSDNT